MNTRFEYVYRDDANYKRFGSVHLSGVISDSDRALIVSTLDSGEMFVAEQVGLPSLRNQWFAEGVSPSTNDNGWHWLVTMASTGDAEETLMPVSEIVRRFRAVGTWRPHPIKAFL